MEDSIFSHILDLERSLLEKDVRSSASKLEKLIHIDFMEIGSSGNVYDYNRVIEELPKQEFEALVLSDEEGRFLSDNLYILNFTIDRAGMFTKRSSIWKNENDEWKLIFHQSTPVLKEL